MIATRIPNAAQRQPRWDLLTVKSPKIRAGWRSVTGNYRPRNEDCCVADVAGGVFLVVDGVGGHAGGAEASEILASTVPAWLRQTFKCAFRDLDIVESAITDAVEAARQQMLDLADFNPELRHMAATMALAVLDDQKLFVTRVGDCRAYRLQGGRLQRLTSDQTFVQAAVAAGLLTEETARNHRWRHAVTNTVGVKPLDEPIEVAEFDVREGDRLLLCSDGLTDVVSDNELRYQLALPGHPQAAADALIQLALDHGSHDNVTCVVVDLAVPDTLEERKNTAGW
jgi:protein phosphatase